MSSPPSHEFRPACHALPSSPFQLGAWEWLLKLARSYSRRSTPIPVNGLCRKPVLILLSTGNYCRRTRATGNKGVLFAAFVGQVEEVMERSAVLYPATSPVEKHSCPEPRFFTFSPLSVVRLSPMFLFLSLVFFCT